MSAEALDDSSFSEISPSSSVNSESGISSLGCLQNCSGHGECINGHCYCQIQFEGSECKTINFSYHVAFASIFFLLALTSLIQLVMCIHAEYLRMKKNPSILKACRVTTQKLLYFLVFLASILRGAYFASPTIGSEWSTSLLSAYYPVVLTGASLIVCFWAEVFHLREIRWDRPRFLSKSYLGFITFNIITYSLFLAEIVLIWVENEDREFYTHIFNGCYAGLMFITVVFFLVYGVEVFFKVRGGFTVPRVPEVINSSRPTRPVLIKEEEAASEAPAAVEAVEGTEGLLQSTTSMVKPPSSHSNHSSSSSSSKVHPPNEETTENLLPRSVNSPIGSQEAISSQMINTSQLHQSRVGLLSQALMMMVTVGFLLAETMEEFWKTKVTLTRRNTQDVIFRVFEVGVTVWFSCVLWNCIRPEQLWCLNPKKILERLPPSLRDVRTKKSKESSETRRPSPYSTDDDEQDDEKGPECWICYDDDRTDAGAMINPCNCRGDVGAVHHDCLRRWLVESADNPDALKCKVCSADYQVEKGSQFSLAQGFTAMQWIQTVSLVSLMSGSIGGGWAVCQLYQDTWIKLLAVTLVLFIQYVCLRFLGLNTVSAYQRAKVSALNIVNMRIRNNGNNDQTPNST